MVNLNVFVHIHAQCQLNQQLHLALRCASQNWQLCRQLVNLRLLIEVEGKNGNVVKSRGKNQGSLEKDGGKYDGLTNNKKSIFIDSHYSTPESWTWRQVAAKTWMQFWCNFWKRRSSVARKNKKSALDRRANMYAGVATQICFKQKWP